MKYKVGDLLYFYPTESKLKLEPLDFGAYWMLIQEYGRPNVLTELGTLGIITEFIPSSTLFLKTIQDHNVYIWHSQQTDREYVAFQYELTTPENHAKMGDYGSSFLVPAKKKKRIRKKN